MIGSTARILIADNDLDTIVSLRTYLEQANFQILTAHDGKTAHAIIRQERPDLVLLDLMLSVITSWDMMRIIRTDPVIQRLPIIVIAAQMTETEKIRVLDCGADDYMTKPINLSELFARTRSLLRRRSLTIAPESCTLLQCNQLVMNLPRREVTVDGQIVHLTRIEFKLLQTLMMNPGCVFTRTEMIEHSLGYDYKSLERTLDTHIKNMRKKIERDPQNPQFIQTVYGVGYVCVYGVTKMSPHDHDTAQLDLVGLAAR